jgi:propanol-preferring alcohol dehydrogenase
VIRSVTNNTRVDGREFLAEAQRVGVRTHVQTYPLDDVATALHDLKFDAVRGAAVIDMRRR